jgi:inorganic pyrophosphatase
MDRQELRTAWELLSPLFRAHPWHGVPIGDEAPAVLNVYVEIVPTDTVKYEADKRSGYLMVNRPQKYSNYCPSLYGFIPQTFSAERVAEKSVQRTGRAEIVGDGDPLDICVLTERPITHGDILVEAIPIGGFRLIDDNEADDKIIAVLRNDAVYGEWTDLKQCPLNVIERLRHYFLTYKDVPGKDPAGPRNRVCEITHIYGRGEAHDVIRRGQADYTAHYGALQELLATARGDALAGHPR